MRNDTASRLGVAALALALALIAGTAVAKDSADVAEKAADKRDRMICKRFIETGSLVKGYRSCKTKREWDWERENIRAARTTSGSCNSGEAGNCGGISAGSGQPLIF